jgi:hypothetical protein
MFSLICILTLNQYHFFPLFVWTFQSKYNTDREKEDPNVKDKARMRICCNPAIMIPLNISSVL